MRLDKSQSRLVLQIGRLPGYIKLWPDFADQTSLSAYDNLSDVLKSYCRTPALDRIDLCHLLTLAINDYAYGNVLNGSPQSKFSVLVLHTHQNR